MKAEIHIEENLNIAAGPKGEIISTEAKGMINVINKSEQTTMWGINLKAEHKEDVKEFTPEIIPHIEASNKYTQDYLLDITPHIKISEVIDTNFDGDEINPSHQDLVFNIDQTLAYKITVTNTYTFPLKNITIEKHLPPDTREIRAIEPFPGTVDVLEEDRIVSWILPELKEGASASIIIASICHPTNVQPYKTGKIVVRCESDNKLSTLEPEIDGECDNVDLSVEANESSAPNQWKIDLGLRNASEFEIFLKEVKIDVNGETKYETSPQQELEVVKDEPIWKQSLIVESETYPEITKKFDYYVLYDITEHSVISYQKEDDYINVLKVSVSKYFEPASVVTYAVTDLVVTFDVTNTGTAPIGKIEIEDTIPADVEIDSVTAESADKKLDVEFLEKPKQKEEPQTEEEREKATFELIEQQPVVEEKPEITPEIPEDTSVERKYHYVITNLDIKPGQLVKIKATGRANKPRSDGTKQAPATIKVYAVNPTIPYITEAEMDGKEPNLVVEFKKRSYKITSIFKKGAEGEFTIEIPVSNTGEVPLDNVVVIQPIFNGQYVSHTPPTVDVTVDGANVRCHIAKIGVGETITITLYVKADGPLRQQQATIRIED
ncbi:MAG: hypothetical protein ACTSYD_09420 [Candidatus Heimdallarchaeaceae archaeon]